MWKNERPSSVRFCRPVQFQFSKETRENTLKEYEHYKTILDVLNCDEEIDVEKFKEYTKETTEMYVQLYDWYPLPPSVHKVLIHGWQIIQALGLSSGCLSEEALEANNKTFKNARAFNSRKCSRKEGNEDVIKYLLVS